MALCNLLISDLDISFRVAREAGDEDMYKHIYATMNRLQKESLRLPIEFLAVLGARLVALRDKWAGKFGYGLSDEFPAFVEEWLERANMFHDDGENK